MDETAFARPVMVASACLGDAAVRYDGRALRDGFLARLRPFVELRPVYPELEIGLGVPRDPILVAGERLVQPSTGRDLTARMGRFARGFLGSLDGVDGFLLKSRSPSCGVGDVKAFDSRGRRLLARRTSGFFARAVLERFPLAAVEDEARLADPALRERFLTRLFALAALRGVRSAADLARFHARHELLLRAWSARAPGRLLARPRRPFALLLEAYALAVRKALARPPRRSAQARALRDAMAYFPEEPKSRLLKCLEAFEAGRVPLGSPLALLRGWLARRPRPRLGDPAFLRPFPEALAENPSPRTP